MTLGSPRANRGAMLLHLPGAPRLRASAAILLVGATGSTPASEPSAVLSRYALSGDLATVVLPAVLDEVSGLAFDDRGRLWAHDDERARIYQLDPVSGKVLDFFDVGRRIRGDWEGIAWAEDRLFLVDSDGVLEEFRPGASGERVAHRRIRTGLGRRCEIEGLGFEPSARRLLVGCKSARERALRGRIVLFSVPLVSMEADREPRVSVPLTSLEAFGLPAELSPAAVEVHPAGGTVLVAAAREETIVELGPDGRVLAGRRLPRGVLRQLEGMAVAPDGALILASEASGGRPKLARVPLDGGGRP